MTTPNFNGYELLLAIALASGLTATVLTFLFEWYAHTKRVQRWKEQQQKYRHGLRMQDAEEEEVWF